MIPDAELLKRHAPSEPLVVAQGCFTNWLGLKTDASMFASRNDIEGRVFPDLPLGGDGVYGGYPEYASLLTAIEAKSERNSFNAVELGAGWGPWISAIGLVCMRLGFKNIRLRGVEADPGKCVLMREHLLRNGLANLDCSVIQGAAWSEDTTLKFPKINSKLDHGGAVSEGGEEVDYRGQHAEYVEVAAYSIKSICEGLDVVDYMHWDIQGAEIEVARAAIEFLNERSRFLFIGTHSRPIEGALLELFFKHGWEVLYQQPCHFVWDLTKPTITGMVHTDGELFLRNPSL